MFIKTFEKLSKSDIKIAGGKGASLGEMLRLGIPVPPGFVVLASTFDRFLEETDIGVEAKAQFDKVNLDDPNSIDNASRTIQGLIENYKMPDDLKKEILKAYDKLGARFVAVRSSATAEDSSVASFAGQLETFLYTDRLSLIANILKCWSSLFSQRAIFYRFEKNLHHSPVSVAVVVQKMLDAEVAGVCFTVHPVTKDKNQMVIEAGWGLGESIVQGIITPDTYVVRKSEIRSQKSEILDINISEQSKKIVYKPGGGTKEVAVSRHARNKQKLSDEKILELAKICQKIEDHYGLPQDIEWGLEKGKLYILQSRPITTL
jgi:pyruvate,water dikinase